ncbi:MAG: hypothetical protein AAF902_01270 [Chloroflexota bacterium]
MQTIIIDPTAPAETAGTVANAEVQNDQHIEDSIKQAIQDLPQLTVDTHQFISADQALEAAAAILFGVQGIQTEADYTRVSNLLNRICAACGFGGEIELNPPAVPFNQRGRYRQRIEVPENIWDRFLPRVLDGHTTLLGTPYHYVWLDRLIDFLSPIIFQKEKYHLENGELDFLEALAAQHMLSSGWNEIVGSDDDTTGRYLATNGRYFKKVLEPNFEGFKREIQEALKWRNGHPIEKRSIRQTGCRGAFRRNVNEDPENIIPSSWWHEVLKACGYMSTCRDNDGLLHPIPLDVPDNIDQLIKQAIEAAQIRSADRHGDRGAKLILAQEIVLELAKLVESLPVGTDAQMQKAIQWFTENTSWARLLVQAGFSPEEEDIWPSQVSPIFEAGQFCRNYGCYKQLGQTDKTPQTIALADGLRVECLGLTRDTDNMLVYMRIIGPRSSVNANWAAVRGARSIYCISARLQPPPKAGAATVRRVLPCGWDDWVIIHHQASLEKMEPGQPFYCAGEGFEEGSVTLLQNFFMRLTKAIETPLLENWASYLWESGIARKLIVPLEEDCHGLLFWQVNPDGAEWIEIVQTGLKEKVISL